MMDARKIEVSGCRDCPFRANTECNLECRSLPSEAVENNEAPEWCGMRDELEGVIWVRLSR